MVQEPVARVELISAWDVQVWGIKQLGVAQGNPQLFFFSDVKKAFDTLCDSGAAPEKAFIYGDRVS